MVPRETVSFVFPRVLTACEQQLDTFEFDQGNVIKNQTIAVLTLLSESLAI